MASPNRRSPPGWDLPDACVAPACPQRCATRSAAEAPAALSAAAMRLLLIVNTSASSVTARARVVIQKALSADHEVILKETNRRGHAARLAQGAAADGLDAVVVLGGDGTLNEAANGLAGSATALAVLPGRLHQRLRPDDRHGQRPDRSHQPAAERSGRRFGGADRVWARPTPATSCSTPASALTLPSCAGSRRWLRSSATPARLLFVVATLMTWAKGYDRRRPAFSVRPARPDRRRALRGCLNTDPYTFFGSRPMHVAPGTTADGDAQLGHVRPLSLADHAAGVLPSALGEGTRRTTLRTCRVIRGGQVGHRKGFRPVPYQLDGDFVGEADQIELDGPPEPCRSSSRSSPRGRHQASHWPLGHLGRVPLTRRAPTAA